VSSSAVRRPARVCARAVTALLGVVVVAAGLIAAGVVAAGPALADDFTPVPSNGVFDITGHGFGHGIGLSQYGAFGAAQQGLSAGEILAFYYPGTVQQQVGDPQIRVHLSAYDSSGITMVAPPGQQMTLTDEATGTKATGPATMYKVTIDASSMHVLFLDPADSTWKPFKVGTTADTVGPVTLATAGGVRMYSDNGTARQYRGSIRIVRLNATTAAAVNYLDMQSYLYGVVPREMPDSWGQPAALQAQAVAARSYALSVATPGANWDICDTTACQVYGGQAIVAANGTVTTIEGANSNPAVDATNGIALYYQGAPAFTQFSASNGGQIAAGTRPYLVAKPDPYDTAAIDPNVNWTAKVSASSLQASYPSVGTVQGLQVVSRDGNGAFGGRIISLEVVGSNGAAPIANTYLGLKSNYWTAGTGPSATPVILNRGVAVGNVESASSAGPGLLTVQGWSFNSIDKSVADFVDVYIDGQFAGRIAANQVRNDVANAFSGAGPFHGFSATFHTGGGTHAVCIYGIDGVHNPQLRCLSATLPSGNPRGNLESVKDIGTGVQLTGWAVDPDTADPVNVHVYVDGKFAGLTTASSERDDVGNAFPGYGSDHGFSIVVNAGQGQHTFCAYAINRGIGTTNPLLGCQTLNLNRNPSGDVVLSGYSNTAAGTAAGTAGIVTATVSGWAVDPDTHDPINVHIYVDGTWAGATSASLDGATQAEAAFPGYGTMHGYTASVHLSPGAHQICAYGINVGQGSTNPRLGCVSINGDSNPIGHLDSVSLNGGQWIAHGWAIDPDSNESIPVDVYVDGKLVLRTQANTSRPDVSSIYAGWGPAVGFVAPLKLSTGKHQICAYGINTGPGTTNPSLGCVTIHA
jgi:SpoIID/LytB domain protein